MLVAQYFVEFIFYSFLGWVWESIYCTIKNKKWADRGFLFGPVCPIYGSCVVAAKIVFTQIPILSTGDTPIWQIFLICMIGSAIAEFITSWVLEKRFHAMWWDYSKVPFNIQGRICLPVSIGFGLAGIVVVKYLLPLVANVQTQVQSPIVYEILMLIFALIFGADFALTEASLSTLLQSIEEYKSEFNRRAEATYENIAAVPKRLEEGAESVKTRVAENAANAKASVGESMANMKASMGEGLSNAKTVIEEKKPFTHRNAGELADNYVGRMSFNQKRILGNIAKFKLTKQEQQERKNWKERMDGSLHPMPAEHLKLALDKYRNKKAS